MHGPMAKRYAKAFLSISIDEKIVEQVGGELSRLGTLLQENKSLQVVILNPGFGFEDRYEVIKTIGQRINISEIVLKFCRFLLEKNRLFYLPQIAKAYQYFADLHSNRLRAVINSARQLEKETIDELTKHLKTQLKQDVIIDAQVSPKLIGGVVTRIGGVVIDGSIKNYLEQVKKEID
jgi:F-type H+-transporting ATPase subunit delta